MKSDPAYPVPDAAACGDNGLREMLEAPLDPVLASAGACLERARSIQRAYMELDRRRLGAERVLGSKFAVLYWRRRLLSRLHDDPPSWLNADHNTWVALAGALQARLPDALLARLARHLPRATHRRLLALQGIPPGGDGELDTLAGPGINLRIRANRRSPWTFARWKRNPAFSRYAFRGDGVDFRGMHFRPGDVLLANVNIDGNGVYTTLSDPKRFASHAAVFAVLEDEDGRYPAVIETFEQGVRPVPLNVFLDARFAAYVEVYRHTALETAHAPRINRAALELMRRAQGYNFHTPEDDWEYVSCCGVGRLLHEDAGLEPASIKSRIDHPRIRDNLARLDYHTVEFFAPVDYLLDPRFECVGWVDNDQFESLLASELAEDYFRELFMTRTLEPDRFPFKARVNRWGINHIRRRSLLGRMIGRLEGFDHRSLPKGPDAVLAVITVAEAEVGRAVRRIRRWLAPFDCSAASFSLSEFAARPAVREHLIAGMKPAWLVRNQGC